MKKYMVYFWDLTSRQNLGIYKGLNRKEVIQKIRKDYHLNENAFIEVEEIF